MARAARLSQTKMAVADDPTAKAIAISRSAVRGLRGGGSRFPILRHCRSMGAMHTVIETPRYQADADRLFTEGEREAIVDIVSSDPRCGVVVPGGGGVRKIRVGFGGRGKRGGARVIFVFGGDDIPVFLLSVFAKNEKDDLAPAERAKMARAVADMLANYRGRA